MRRPLVTSIFAAVLALAPAALFAQATPPATPQAAPAAPAQPAAPKLGFTGPAGMLLVTVKGDQTAAFEELIAKLKAGLAKAEKPEVKAQAAGLKFYKAAEPAAGGNAMYVVVADPAAANSEYALLNLLAATMTADEQRAEGVREMFLKYADTIAAINRLNLTPVGGQ